MNLFANVLKNSRLLRYLTVGGGVYLLEIGVIVVAQTSGASDVLAVGIAFWVGLLVSFILQKFVTFGDKRTHHKIIIKQLLAVTALVVWNFGFTILLTNALVDTVPAPISRTIALLITTVWNFQLYRISIFRGTENPIY